IAAIRCVCGSTKSRKTEGELCRPPQELKAFRRCLNQYVDSDSSFSLADAGAAAGGAAAPAPTAADRTGFPADHAAATAAGSHVGRAGTAAETGREPADWLLC